MISTGPSDPRIQTLPAGEHRQGSATRFCAAALGFSCPWQGQVGASSAITVHDLYPRGRAGSSEQPSEPAERPSPSSQGQEKGRPNQTKLPDSWEQLGWVLRPPLEDRQRPPPGPASPTHCSERLTQKLCDLFPRSALKEQRLSGAA